MISTDIQTTGAGVETPPAVGMYSADQVRLVAPTPAPWTGTAPTGSSTRMYSTRSVASGTSTPATAPMMMAPSGSIQ